MEKAYESYVYKNFSDGKNIYTVLTLSYSLGKPFLAVKVTHIEYNFTWIKVISAEEFDRENNKIVSYEVPTVKKDITKSKYRKGDIFSKEGVKFEVIEVLPETFSGDIPSGDTVVQEPICYLVSYCDNNKGLGIVLESSMI